MATLDDILNLGNIPLTDPVTNRLPSPVEATLPVAIGKGVANGVAALNGAGVPVTTGGVPMATVGTASGQAAEAVATATAVTAANTAATAANTNANGRVKALGSITSVVNLSSMPTVAEAVALNLPNGTLIVTPGT